MITAVVPAAPKAAALPRSPLRRAIWHRRAVAEPDTVPSAPGAPLDRAVAAVPGSAIAIVEAPDDEARLDLAPHTGAVLGRVRSGGKFADLPKVHGATRLAMQAFAPLIRRVVAPPARVHVGSRIARTRDPASPRGRNRPAMARHRSACLAFAVLLGWAGAASAHAHLKDASPAAGARVTASPAELRLGFSEGVNLRFTGVSVTGPAGPVPTGTAALAHGDDRVLIVPVSRPLAPGAYVVDWHALAADGHRTTGRYGFTVGP